MWVCLPKPSRQNRHIRIFPWLRKQQPRFARGQPKGYFHVKELNRTTEAIAEWMRGGEGWDMLSSMCEHVARLQFASCSEKDKAFVEESWWPQFDLFESMPWCSAWRKWIGNKVYSLNLMRFCLPKPSRQNRHIRIFMWLRKQQPRFAQRQPKGYFQVKELNRTTEAIAEWMRGGEGWDMLFNVGLAYWIWALFAICLPLQKAGLFASDPPPTPNEPYNFLCEMTPYVEICYAYSGGAGGPSPKVRAFCNSEWPDSGKFCGSIACPCSTSLWRYSQETQGLTLRCGPY